MVRLIASVDGNARNDKSSLGATLEENWVLGINGSNVCDRRDTFRIRSLHKRIKPCGLANVAAEWKLLCSTHNLLKLFRSGWTPQSA